MSLNYYLVFSFSLTDRSIINYLEVHLFHNFIAKYFPRIVLQYRDI